MTTEDTFSPGRAARRVLRTADIGSLATLQPDGGPFASMVTVATTPGGEPILLLSRLAVHTRNLERDARASLLLVAPGGETGDPLAGARLTLVGRVTPVEADSLLPRRFLARHPEAADYSTFADFGFRRFVIASGHLVAGFGRIVDLDPDLLQTDCAGAEGLIAAEEGAVAHMNEDHADAIRLYATGLLGESPGEWRMIGADPDGADLRAGPRRARLEFPAKAKTSADLRRILVEFAGEARRRGADGTAATG